MLLALGLGSALLGACVVSETDRKMLENGFARYSARQFNEAQRAADQFIQKNPGAPNLDEAYYLRGVARMSKEGTTERAAAYQDLQTAIEKTTRNDVKAKSHRALGDLAFDTQQWQQAVDAYQKGLSFGPPPNDAWFHYRLGAALQCLGQWDKAKPSFQRVITLGAEPVLTQRAFARVNLTSFSLQFPPFKEQPRAAELVRQLKTPSQNNPPIQATIATEVRDGQLVYVVRTGSFPNWQEASDARTRLLARDPRITIFP